MEIAKEDGRTVDEIIKDEAITEEAINTEWAMISNELGML